MLKRTSGEQTTLLEKLKNTWITVRDSECEFQSLSSKGGSINSMIHFQYLADKTKERNEELNKMLSCQEGE